MDPAINGKIIHASTRNLVFVWNKIVTSITCHRRFSCFRQWEMHIEYLIKEGGCSVKANTVFYPGFILPYFKYSFCLIKAWMLYFLDIFNCIISLLFSGIFQGSCSYPF